MITENCTPTRAELVGIRQSLVDLLEITHHWNYYSGKAGYPTDMGLFHALSKIFDLERALNPNCLPWDHPKRQRGTIEGWPFKIEMGLFWLRDHLDTLMSRAGVQTMASFGTIRDWAKEFDFSSFELPSYLADLRSFELVVEALGPVDGWAVVYPADNVFGERAPKRILTGFQNIQIANTPTTISLDPPSTRGRICPVVLRGPGESPLVDGHEVDPITSEADSVIAALVRAFEKPGRLSEEQLIAWSGTQDARKILVGLQSSNALWRGVIMMSTKKKLGYGLRASTRTATSPGTASLPWS